MADEAKPDLFRRIEEKARGALPFGRFVANVIVLMLPGLFGAAFIAAAERMYDPVSWHIYSGTVRAEGLVTLLATICVVFLFLRRLWNSSSKTETGTSRYTGTFQLGWATIVMATQAIQWKRIPIGLGLLLLVMFYLGWAASSLQLFDDPGRDASSIFWYGHAHIALVIILFFAALGAVSLIGLLVRRRLQ